MQGVGAQRQRELTFDARDVRLDVEHRLTRQPELQVVLHVRGGGKILLLKEDEQNQGQTACPDQNADETVSKGLGFDLVFKIKRRIVVAVQIDERFGGVGGGHGCAQEGGVAPVQPIILVTNAPAADFGGAGGPTPRTKARFMPSKP